jgi:hypothetical protein
MICPNSLTGYTLVSVMDYHIMPNNFNALFCCGCEIKIQERKAPQQNFCICLVKLMQEYIDYYFARSRKRTEDFQFVELFRAEKNAKVNPCI